jgi:NAD(P)-dependent dehydrogenase (short-subunit alcohol dehydrogenase family)
MAGLDPQGRVALITGSARGIGWETARALHARGASVVISDLSEEGSREGAARIGAERTHAIAADATDVDALRAAVDGTVERFGGLDIVVANAGIAPIHPRTARVTDPQLFERILETNLNGVYRTVQAALPQIVERRGHIVVVASVYAFMNGMLNAAYAMAKAGVEQYGRALRTELAQHGVGVSVAYFGFIDTDMVRIGFEDEAIKKFEQTFPKFMLKRRSAAEAGEAIARGIEQDRPRIVVPSWWRVWSMARGPLNAMLDRRSLSDAQIQEAVRDGDQPDEVDGATSTADVEEARAGASA